MHALLLTVVALGGATVHISDRDSSPAPTIHATTLVGRTAARPAAMSRGCADECSSCNACNGDGCNDGRGGGCRTGLLAKKATKGCGRGMPQTCYSPRYGCYYSNNRHMERYPAFHGTFYRRPYNYRNYFDYPWHAEMHEPTSMFSYNVVGEPVAAPDSPPVPPVASRPAPKRSVISHSESAIGTGVAPNREESQRRVLARPISLR